jgi:hypothetical protein
MRLAEAVKVKYIDTKQASPTSLALGWLAWVLLQNRTRVARIQTVLAFTAETPDLGYGVVGTMGSSQARLSVSTSSGAPGKRFLKFFLR